MKHIVELPDEIERRLASKAAESGQDVSDLIRAAVGQFVSEHSPLPTNANWSESIEQRRRALIDKEIAGTIAAEEERELAELDCIANEHFDRIASPPMEGARRLHEELVRKRNRLLESDANFSLQKSPR